MILPNINFSKWVHIIFKIMNKGKQLLKSMLTDSERLKISDSLKKQIESDILNWDKDVLLSTAALSIKKQYEKL
jgi:hypothetical protein